MAIAIQDGPRKIFLSPTVTDEASALGATPEWIPEQQLPDDARAFTPIIYGFRTYASLFTNRQLIALTTLSDAIRECEPEIRDACVNAGWPDDDLGLENGGKGPQAYAEALMTYLAFAVSQYSRFLVSFASWNPENQNISHGFGRQAIPVSWDFPEANPFIGRLTFETAIGWITTPLKSLLSLGAQGDAEQKDARRLIVEGMGSVVSTDPPYYDNVPYAELADFFYIWIRRVLRDVYPRMLSTRATPKKDELVAAPHRQGGREASQLFFLDGMTDAMRAIASVSHPAFPVTLYYAFKQADVSGSDTTSTGWETFLEAVIAAGFNITGTWPLSTERAARKRGKNSNALSSSILLVCRVREIDAGVLSRRDFLRHLKLTLPDALIEMTRGGENSPVAPVDLSQAIIGPGIGIFSRYKAVLEADGTPMTVKTALQLINRFLADDDFDPETRFCLQWFETNYWKEGLYGQADVGARASGAGVDTIAHAGLLRSGGGKVRLLRPAELAEGWQPERRNQTPVWEGLHHLIHTLNTHGEQAAGALLAAMPAISGPARTLCYRLYTLCERQKLAEDARTYNELIGAWAAIEVAAQEHGYVETQTELF
jgi:putative DNA methylase